MKQWDVEDNLTVYGLLIRTDDIEELIDVVENGHPSIDESHFSYNAIQQLGLLESDEIIELWEEYNKMSKS